LVSQISEDEMETLDAPSAQRPTRKTLWAVQDKGGEGQPFIFVLAGYGDAWVAQGLARALGPEHTVYGIQPPSDAAAKTARELAAIYVEHLRAVQPNGPYCLGGYSAGAVMALEIAIQLRAQGEVVGLVALLDPLFIRYTRLEHLSYHGLQRVCRLVEKIVPSKPRLLQILAAMFEDEGLESHLKALTGYKPHRYPGDVVFYQARWSLGRSPLLVRQWKWFTRARLKVETAPGDHHTFIRPPHVKELARRLRSELQKAGASRSQ
jgi:thioesterase domain-containing protein